MNLIEYKTTVSNFTYEMRSEFTVIFHIEMVFGCFCFLSPFQFNHNLYEIDDKKHKSKKFCFKSETL